MKAAFSAAAKTAPARLRLYIAAATPNSLRAERNLRAALDLMDAVDRPQIEIVDVFTHPKRAVTDGVIATPTLIAITPKSRITLMGDLTDRDKLMLLLSEAPISL